MNSFAKRLEVLLEEKDMKQNELAKRIGVSEVTISRYMTADRKPRTDIATKISKELGVSTDYLLGESNTRNPEQTKEPAPVTDVEEAMKIILDQPGLMLKGNMLSDESKIILANSILNGIKLAEELEKHKKGDNND